MATMTRDPDYKGLYLHDNGNYYVRTMIKGVPITRSLGVSKKHRKLAIIRYQTFFDNVFVWKITGKSPISESIQDKTNRVRIQRALAEWVSKTEQEEKSKGTVNLKKQIKRIIKEIGINFVKDINQEFIDKFYKHLNNKQYKPNTIIQIIKKLKGFINFCVDQKYLLLQIKAELKYKTIKKTYKSANCVLNEEDYNKILNHFPDQRRKMYLKLLWNTGFRPVSEGLNVRYRDIDFEKQNIYCKQSKVEDTSNKPEKWVQITKEFANELKKYCEEYNIIGDRYLFRAKDWPGKQVDEYISKNWRAIANKIGLSENIVVYSFRHAFATRLYVMGLRMEFIADQLGHSDTDETKTYIHTLLEDNKKMFDEALKNQKL